MYRYKIRPSTPFHRLDTREKPNEQLISFGNLTELKSLLNRFMYKRMKRLSILQISYSQFMLRFKPPFTEDIETYCG